MKTRLFSVRRIVPLLLLLTASFAGAALPDRPTHFVTDQAGIIDTATAQQLNALLADLEQKTGAQVAVVTVTSLEGRTVEDFSIRLFDKLKPGRKDHDDGILFLIAPNERLFRIEVGYGLERLITDAGAGRIRDQFIIPSFQAGQLSQGIAAGTFAIAQIIAEDKGVTLSMQGPQRPPEPRSSKGGGLLFFIIFVIFIVLFRQNPLLALLLLSGGRRRGGGWSGGGFGGGGFGGFGGGSSGGGGASGRW